MHKYYVPLLCTQAYFFSSQEVPTYCEPGSHIAVLPSLTPSTTTSSTASCRSSPAAELSGSKQGAVHFCRVWCTYGICSHTRHHTTCCVFHTAQLRFSSPMLFFPLEMKIDYSSVKCVVWKLDAGGIHYVIKMNVKDAFFLNGQHSELLQIWFVKIMH